MNIKTNTKNNYFKSKILFFAIVGLITLIPKVVFAIPAFYQRCEPGIDCVIGEFLFADDANTPVTTANYCQITITDPNDGAVATNLNLANKGDGWYYYTFNGTNPEGIYRTKFCCDTGADKRCMDKTFVLGTSFDSLPAKIWSYTGSALDTTGNAISKVWSFSNRSLTTRQIGLNEYIAGVASSSTVTQVANSTDQASTKYTIDLIRQATFDFAGIADSGSAITLVDAELDNPDDYWVNYELVMMSGNNIGQRRVVSGFSRSAHTITVSSAFSYSISAGDKYIISHESKLVNSIWNYTSRTLTGFGTLVADIWSYNNKTLTSFGTLIADIWNNPTRRLSDKQLVSGDNLATENYIDLATSSIIIKLDENKALLQAMNNISASDVWAYANRSLSTTTDISTASQEAIWNVALSKLNNSGTVGKMLVDNLDVAISTRGTSSISAADVWNVATRSLTDYSTSSIAAAVWNNGTRDLTNYGNNITAADVWNVLSSTLVNTGTIGNQLIATSTPVTSWSISLIDVDRISAGKSYRAKVYLQNNLVLTDPANLPTATVYDVSRNMVAQNIGMTKVTTGVYEYVYTVPTGAVQGNWETVINVVPASGQSLQTSDYFEVQGSPAQVIINSISDDTVPSIAVNVTITNEGLSGYEYQYKWCVVDSADKLCDGVNDVYYATAAKYINPGENWNTQLTANVTNPGNYYFKLIVTFGTEQSGSSRSFTARQETVNQNQPSGGGGGGGGGYIAPVTPLNPEAPVVSTSTIATSAPVVISTSTIATTSESTPQLTCSGADFNHDTKVNSIDFSILLAFWKTSWPFKNPCVDLNNDKKVDSVDFSILMYQWGRKK